MRKLSVVFLLCSLSVSALADELTDAHKLWENKQFVAAFAAFSKLAASGNPGAQLQLGEMYGFGEGTREDVAQDRIWLGEAAKAGHPDAANSLALVNQRAARKDEITYYTSRFDGGDARYEKFNCEQPVLPDSSQTQAEIQTVVASIDKWRACYDRFAVNLNRVAAPDKTIPADVLVLMNNEEFQQASHYIEQTYMDISKTAQKNGARVYENIDNWVSRTSGYLKKKQVADSSLMQILRSQRASDSSNMSDAVMLRNEMLGKRK